MDIHAKIQTQQNCTCGIKYLLSAFTIIILLLVITGCDTELQDSSDEVSVPNNIPRGPDTISMKLISTPADAPSLTIVEVIDAVTYSADIDGTIQTVKLAGVSIPDDATLADSANNYASSEILSKVYKYEQDGNTTDSHPLVYLYDDYGHSFNQSILSDGEAIVDESQSDTKYYGYLFSAQHYAEFNETGLWGN
ncbi:MAG: hypothetical protein LBN34_02405 [Clostridiales Family XIII bacterium]|jgi:hypothetical protein|nr:hypothetical protein [Clostridiales Family XIII bacterium]